MTGVRVDSAVAANGQPAVPRPLLSIVLPAHDEAESIGATLRRIAALAACEAELAGRVEVIVVNDGSTDSTFAEACDGLRRGLGGTVIDLAVNAGSHAAIRCGLSYATGDFVAIIAADGQDPPEALPAMLRQCRGPVEVVWARRRARRNDRASARLTATAFYRAFRLLTGVDYPPSGLDIFVARRRVIETLLKTSGRNSSVTLSIYNLGFRQAFVEYDRGARSGGRSSWTLRKRLKLAVDMLSSHSAAPIRTVSLTGIVACLAGIVLGGVSLVGATFENTPWPGWAAFMVVVALIGGSILAGIALLGEYVWRMLDELRGAPLFIEARHERVQPATELATPEER